MSGRHFLQIPGPTNVPDRVLRAIAQPTIDHRGAEFAALGHEVLDGLKRVFKTSGAVVDLPGVGHRRLGSGAGEHAVAGRQGAGVRERRVRAAVDRGGAADGARRRGRARRLAARRRSGDRSRSGCAPIAAHQIKALLVVHNETSTGATTRMAAVRDAIDRAGHPALLLVDAVSSLASIDVRHDEWRVDVTLSSSQKGLMLPPGLGFNAISEKALAASRTARLPRSYWAWEPMLAANAVGVLSLHAVDQPALRPARSAADAGGGRAAAGVRPPRPAGGGGPRRRPALGAARSPASAPDEYSNVVTTLMMPDGHDADRLRAHRPRAVQPVARRRPRPAEGTRVPHRPPGRFQRADADGHAVRRRDGARARRRAVLAGWRGCGDGPAVRGAALPSREARRPLGEERRHPFAEIVAAVTRRRSRRRPRPAAGGGRPGSGAPSPWSPRWSTAHERPACRPVRRTAASIVRRHRPAGSPGRAPAPRRPASAAP